MKWICLLIWLAAFSVGHAQFATPPDTGKFSPKIRVGASYTYIWDEGVNYLRENTFALNVGVMVKPRINIGVNWLNIGYSTRFEQSGRGFLIGTFGQYHLGKRLDKATIFLETGAYLGNYCTCDDPHRQDGLVYVPFGGGLNAKLHRGLWLDAGFLVYNILNKVPGKYSYTQYVVGLDWVFGK